MFEKLLPELPETSNYQTRAGSGSNPNYDNHVRDPEDRKPDVKEGEVAKGSAGRFR